jgi:Spy/CpxP family protein refolding chaperone
MNMNSFNTHSDSACNPIGKWLINRKLRKLKLDASQKEKLDALFAIASSARKDHAIVKSEAQERFTTMMTDEGYDVEKAAELIRTAADQHADGATDIAEAFADLYQALEPWQQQQVLAMWQKRGHCRSRRCH